MKITRITLHAALFNRAALFIPTPDRKPIMIMHCFRSLLATCGVLALVCASSPAAEDAQTKPASRVLAVGETVKVKVRSKEKFNPTGLKVGEGEYYSFTIAQDAKWKDLTIVCDANGWLSKDAAAPFRSMIEKSEKNRRVPAANWFEMVGTIGRDEQHHFQIGLRGAEWTYTAAADGELFLFANDLMAMYGNNSGEIEVTVTRQAKASKQQLPWNPEKKSVGTD